MSSAADIAENNAGEAVAVFCRPEDAPSLEDAFNRLGRLTATIKPGGPREALAWCTQTTPPGILIVDISEEAHPTRSLAELGAVVGPGCRIIALGDKQDVNLYRKLLQLGVFDYLVTPLQLVQLSETLTRANESIWLVQPQPGCVRAGQTVAVVGATGGVGASTVVAALGQQLAGTHNIPTVLVDYDRRGSNLALLLGLEANSGLAGVLAASEVDLRLIQRALLTQEGRNGAAQRLHLLAQRPGEETPVDPELLLQLGVALCELYSMSVWDIPSHRPGGSDGLLAHADIRIIVTDYTLQNARATRMLLTDFGDESQGQRLFLVVNASRHRSRQFLPRDQFEEFLGWRVDLELPHVESALDASLLEGSLNLGRAPAFKEGMERLSNALLGNPSAPAHCPGIIKRIRQSLRLR
ncbi:hypothetical protein GKC30_12895 [Pseudodesulfovibrio sp. F-1]|uniref:Response regulatory domain-containing protein n=1 Tax=Pseudodesulfovibrio alkaliphilus TaxID=2661613 RepID=A0A7K1KR19_9BACT|nr:hypothetical protein [Pseudodesulfovibrio alkaliphilus]MUM78534.1 hypothetical protein [Pseudodesulfovibrio alkaliphilus]